jgi:3-oxoacyl-[acyl-carrier protein] reductase
MRFRSRNTRVTQSRYSLVRTNYAAAKAGIIGFTKAMAKEYGGRNIAVNAVAPGYIPTDLTSGLPPEITESIIKLTAYGRAGTPEEVANAVAFLI